MFVSPCFTAMNKHIHILVCWIFNFELQEVPTLAVWGKLWCRYTLFSRGSQKWTIQRNCQHHLRRNWSGIFSILGYCIPFLKYSDNFMSNIAMFPCPCLSFKFIYCVIRPCHRHVSKSWQYFVGMHSKICFY
jgi:hypothetical protein